MKNIYFYLIAIFMLFSGSPNALADQYAWANGWDPGMKIRRAFDPSVGGFSDFRDFHYPSGAQYGGMQGYELVFVAEQGGDTNNRRHTARREGSSYWHDPAKGVNPFYFNWSGSASNPIANLFTDSHVKHFDHRFYYNGAGERKNSQDDSMFIGIFEQDNYNGSAHMPHLVHLVYEATVLNDGPYYTPRPHALKQDGGRVIFGIGWKNQGVDYLVEINIGGKSDNQKWGTGDACVKDHGGHGNLKARHIILGAEGLSGITKLKNNSWTKYKIRWGEILRSLQERPVMYTGDPKHPKFLNCRLDTSLYAAQNNSIGVGIASEVHGAVKNRLLVKDTKIDFSPRYMPWHMPKGFYRFGGSSYFVNGNGAYCLITRTDNNRTYTSLPGLPSHRKQIYQGRCAGQPSFHPSYAYEGYPLSN